MKLMNVPRLIVRQMCSAGISERFGLETLGKQELLQPEYADEDVDVWNSMVVIHDTSKARL